MEVLEHLHISVEGKRVVFALILILYKPRRGDALLTSSRPEAAAGGLTLFLKRAVPVR